MLKNILTTFSTKVIAGLVSFILLLFTTNYLGATGRGTISLLIVSCEIINLLSGFIGGTALIYLVPRNKNRTFLNRVFIISYIWICLASGMLTIIFILTKSIPDSLVSHVLLLGILSAMFNFHLFLLISFEKIFLQNLSAIVQVLLVLFAFTGAIFIFESASVISFILSLYLSYSVSMLLSLFFVIKNLPHKKDRTPLLNSVKEIIRFGFISQLSNIFQYLNHRFSYYILNYYTNIAFVGIYSVGVAISEAVWTIPGSISLIQYARIANLNDLSYSRQITIYLAKLSFILTLFAISSILLIPADIFVSVFGKDFKPVKDILFYLSPGIVAIGYATIISYYFAGIGKYIINSIASSLGLLVNLIFNFLLVPSYGYTGAAVAATLSHLTTGIFLIVAFLKEARVPVISLFPSKGNMKIKR